MHGYHMEGHNCGAAVEVDTIGEQQLKRTQSGEQQLCIEGCQHRIAHIGEQGGRN